jgi:flagellar basal-body rod protein FlgF
MVRGLYTSGWSMMALGRKMDVVSNNLANVNTTAFKKDTVIMESFPEVLTKRINDVRSRLNPSGRVGTMEMGSDVGEVFTYYRQGQLVRTGSRYDLAIRDSDTAFFTVEVPDAEGNIRHYYTRDGQFTLDPDGRLVTKDGYTVAGEFGPIYLYDGDFVVEEDGSVIQNGEFIGVLLIKEFSNPETLRKYGSNLVEATGETVEGYFTGNVEQGFIEQSNVNVVREMVDMITVMRSYEANQKMVQAIDMTLEKAVNEVGAVR